MASWYIEREEVKFVWCAHVHFPGYMKETVEFHLAHMNWFSVRDVGYVQVFTDSICITKA